MKKQTKTKAATGKKKIAKKVAKKVVKKQTKKSAKAVKKKSGWDAKKRSAAAKKAAITKRILKELSAMFGQG